MPTSLVTLPAELRLLIFRYLFLTLEPIVLLPAFFLFGRNEPARLFFEGFNLLFTTKLIAFEVHQLLRHPIVAAVLTSPTIYPTVHGLSFNHQTRALQINTIGMVGVWPSRVKYLRLDVPVMQNAFVSQLPVSRFTSLEIIVTDINIQCNTGIFDSDIFQQFTNEYLAKERRKSPEWKPIFEGLKPILTVTGALIASHNGLNALILDNQNMLGATAVDFDFIIQRRFGPSHRRWPGDVRVSFKSLVPR